MNKVRRQRRNSSQQSKLLEQWSKSGESAERFAARVGVTPATLARWRKAVASEPERLEDAPVAQERKSKDKAASMFARVQVVEPATHSDGLVEVVMRDGIMLRIHGVVDADTLGAVLGALSRC
jgi:transcriptional regulator with XRE-family HTH domain